MTILRSFEIASKVKELYLSIIPDRWILSYIQLFKNSLQIEIGPNADQPQKSLPALDEGFSH